MMMMPRHQFEPQSMKESRSERSLSGILNAQLICQQHCSLAIKMYQNRRQLMALRPLLGLGWWHTTKVLRPRNWHQKRDGELGSSAISLQPVAGLRGTERREGKRGWKERGVDWVVPPLQNDRRTIDYSSTPVSERWRALPSSAGGITTDFVSSSSPSTLRSAAEFISGDDDDADELLPAKRFQTSVDCRDATATVGSLRYVGVLAAENVWHVRRMTRMTDAAAMTHRQPATTNDVGWSMHSIALPADEQFIHPYSLGCATFAAHNHRSSSSSSTSSSFICQKTA